MTIEEMTMEALDHWYTHHRKTFNRMKARGDVGRQAEAAARLTRLEMDTWIKGGATEYEAWEASRELFILCDPAKHYHPDDGGNE